MSQQEALLFLGPQAPTFELYRVSRIEVYKVNELRGIEGLIYLYIFSIMMP